MSFRDSSLRLLLALFIGALPCTAIADLIVDDFSSLNGDSTGDTAGPFVVDGISMTMTTLGTTSGRLLNNTRPGGDLGLTGGTSDDFDSGESWSFSLDEDFVFAGIDLQDVNADFSSTISSTDWIGIALTPGSSNVSFNPSTGTLSLGGGEGSDDFDRTDLMGTATDALTVSAGTPVIFTTDDDEANVEIQSITFAAVPEPSNLGVIALASIWFRHRRKS